MGFENEVVRLEAFKARDGWYNICYENDKLVRKWTLDDRIGARC